MTILLFPSFYILGRRPYQCGAWGLEATLSITPLSGWSPTSLGLRKEVLGLPGSHCLAAGVKLVPGMSFRAWKKCKTSRVCAPPLEPSSRPLYSIFSLTLGLGTHQCWGLFNGALCSGVAPVRTWQDHAMPGIKTWASCVQSICSVGCTVSGSYTTLILVSPYFDRYFQQSET